jgi:predicted membrane protein
MAENNTVPNNKRSFPAGVVFPVFIVALGVIFLLDQIGIVSANHIFSAFWPAILLYFGLAGLLFHSGPGRFWGALMTLAGILLLLSEYGYFHVNFAIFWPLAIILWGLWLMGHALSGNPQTKVGVWAGKWAEGFSSTIGSDTSNPEVDLVTVFSAVRRRIISQNFKGGKLVAVFGEFKVDLTDADIEGDYAEMEATAVFGAGEVRVPEKWMVSVRGAAVFGEYQDRTHQQPAPGSPTKRLVIKGGAVFGSVVIKN